MVCQVNCYKRHVKCTRQVEGIVFPGEQNWIAEAVQRLHMLYVYTWDNLSNATQV